MDNWYLDVAAAACKACPKDATRTGTAQFTSCQCPKGTLWQAGECGEPLRWIRPPGPVHLALPVWRMDAAALACDLTHKYCPRLLRVLAPASAAPIICPKDKYVVGQQCADCPAGSKRDGTSYYDRCICDTGTWLPNAPFCGGSPVDSLQLISKQAGSAMALAPLPSMQHRLLLPILLPAAVSGLGWALPLISGQPACLVCAALGARPRDHPAG